jgi:hypothetical protein
MGEGDWEIERNPEARRCPKCKRGERHQASPADEWKTSQTVHGHAIGLPRRFSSFQMALRPTLKSSQRFRVLFFANNGERVSGYCRSYGKALFQSSKTRNPRTEGG